MKPPAAASLCMVHDPARAAEQSRTRSAGGLASAMARRELLTPADLGWVSLHNRTAVQAVLESVLRLEFLGQLPPARGRLLVRILGAAIRNLGPHGSAGDLPDMDDYAAQRQAFVAAADNLCYTARDADRGREYGTISHESAWRTQRYRDEDDFGRGPEGPMKPLTPAMARTLCAPFDESLINPPPPEPRQGPVPSPAPADRESLWRMVETLLSSPEPT